MYTSSLPHITTPQDHNTHSQGAQHHAYAKILFIFALVSSATHLSTASSWRTGQGATGIRLSQNSSDEPKRFQMLVLSLTDEPVNPIYQVQNTSFFDKLHFSRESLQEF